MELRQVWDRVTEIFGDVSRAVDRHLSIFVRRTRSNWRRPTHSWGRPDYDYWRRAYNCQVSGLELSGLFIRPIVNKIASWVLGRPANFQCKNKRSQTELESWWDIHHSEMLRAFVSALKQGDSFFVINSDLSVSIVSPDTVDPIVSEDDYGKRVGWRIRQVFPHPQIPSQKMTVTDEYYIDRRVQTVEFTDGRKSVKEYPNLIGVIPVVHIANQPTDGEEFGHPEAEALVDILHRYGQTLEAAVEGNVLQGRPTPVISFNTVQDLNAFWRRYGRKTVHRKMDGTTEETDTLTIDMSDILTISGANFTYESPGSFAEDTERLLGLMFYLLLEHIELPEFVFGNAIEGSKSSAETQMPVFEVFIKRRQKECRWIAEAARIVLGYLSIIKPGVSIEDPVLQWPKLTQNGRLTLDAITWAYTEELIDERTALILLPADIERPEEVLKQAKKDAEKRRQKKLENQEAELKLQSTIGGGTGNGNGNVNPNARKNEMDPSLEQELETLIEVVGGD